MKLLLTFMFVAFALTAVLADEKKVNIVPGHFLLNIWRNKMSCDEKPDIPLTLKNEGDKCQVVVKDFFWAKGACEGSKLVAKVCTDAQCSKCNELKDIKKENVCGSIKDLNLAYKYTCSATPQNVTEIKKVAAPTEQEKKEVAEKAKEELKPSDQQKVESSETVIMIINPVEKPRSRLRKGILLNKTRDNNTETEDRVLSSENRESIRDADDMTDEDETRIRDKCKAEARKKISAKARAKAKANILKDNRADLED